MIDERLQLNVASCDSIVVFCIVCQNIRHDIVFFSLFDHALVFIIQMQVVHSQQNADIRVGDHRKCEAS